MKAIIHYVLAILEGGLAGGFFYHAGQEKDKERKLLLYVISALCFCASLLDSMAGGKAWKEAREAKKAKALACDGGEYEDD